jgi:hypothetical protein
MDRKGDETSAKSYKDNLIGIARLENNERVQDSYGSYFTSMVCFNHTIAE